MPAKIAPSILSADFSRLAEEVADVEKGGADWIHVDVMDGHFVPNLTIGPVVVSALKGKTKLPLDCHLMVSRPEDWVDEFARAGARVITVHVEATAHKEGCAGCGVPPTPASLDRLLARIREKGCLAGVSLNPATPVSALTEVLSMVDLVLVMSVNPGFGGQKFIESSVRKLEDLARLRREKGYKFLLEIDGGVNAENAPTLIAAGADVLVAGNAVFGAPARAAAIAALRKS